MKLITLSLVVTGFCFVSNGYAMEQQPIEKVVQARDQLVKAMTIMESRDRVMQMSIFKFPGFANSYDIQERRVAINCTNQAHVLLSSVLDDAYARPEHKRVAGSLLRETIEMQAKIRNYSKS